MGCVGHTFGSCAPGKGTPRPSRTRKVGICVSEPVMELKKLSSEMIGEFEVGKWPWAGVDRVLADW